MDTEFISIIIQLLTPILTITIALITAIILYKTVKSNNKLNQRIIFNEVVKQERELRIKFNEYKEEINKRLKKSEKFEEITLGYDTLLFNYYEYLAICVYKNLINEKETKLYFKGLLGEVRDMFEHSILFEENYANKNQYRFIQWLFRKWKINF